MHNHALLGKMPVVPAAGIKPLTFISHDTPALPITSDKSSRKTVDRRAPTTQQFRSHARHALMRA